MVGFPHSSVGKESTCNAGDPGSKIPWRRDALPIPVFLGFPWGKGLSSINGFRKIAQSLTKE